MKKSFFVKLLTVVILFSLNTSIFAQKKWAGMTLYTVRNEMGKDPKATPVSYTHLDVYKRQLIPSSKSSKLKTDISSPSNNSLYKRSLKGRFRKN